MRDNRNLDTEQRRLNCLAEHVLVAVVVWVRDERDTGRQKLWASGLDENLALWPDRGIDVEANAVIGGGLVAIFELCLGNCGSESDVPQGRCHRLVSLTAGEVVQESLLRNGLSRRRDGLVGLGPINREPELTPERFENLLVFYRQLLAKLNEVSARNSNLIGGLAALVVATLERRGETGHIRKVRIAANPVVVLNAALGRQPVVIPAHRVENLEATHALEAGNHVGVGVAKDVTYVQ